MHKKSLLLAMFSSVLRRCLMVVFVLLLSFPSFAQKKKRTAKPVTDTANALVHEYFRGTIIYSSDTLPTMLELKHKRGRDEGDFMMVETARQPDGISLPLTAVGKWSVQKRQRGDDDEVNVLELIGKDAELAVFFTRKNDSTLQKLSGTFEELMPAEWYTLSKISAGAFYKDSLSEHDYTMLRFTGTYKGRLPCADCSGLTTTLALRFKAHAKSGDYTLTDKYAGTRTGDVTNEHKGKWSYLSKQIEADRKSYIIVLDLDKRGHETYYLVKKDGIIQLDHNMHRIDGPGDRTLRR